MKFKLKNTKKDRIIQISVVIVGIALATVILILLFSNSKNNLNEGAFKLNDVVVSNTLDLTDMLLGNDITDSNISYDISTNSKINISIAKLSNNISIKSAYIDNFKTNFDYNYNIYTNIKEMKYVTNKTKFDIVLEEKENTYETDFYIACLNIEKGLSLKTDMNKKTLLSSLDTSIYEDTDKIGKVSFDLNIVDSKNETYTVTLKYKIDLTNFLNDNYYVNKLNINDNYFTKE